MGADFERKSEEILLRAIGQHEIDGLEEEGDSEKFQDDLWYNFKMELGQAFMEVLSEWNDEETYLKVMKILKRDRKDDK